MRGVVIISTKSGEVRELHRHEYPTRRDRQCGNLLWSPDGRSLLYGVANPASDGCTLQRLSIEDGESTPIAELPAHNMSQLHPEGTRIAFRHGEWRGEIWVMEYGRIEER
jgi:hypothetical protein